MDVTKEQVTEIIRGMRGLGFNVYVPLASARDLTLFAPARSRMVLGAVIGEVLGFSSEVLDLLQSAVTARPEFYTPEPGVVVVFVGTPNPADRAPAH